MSTLLRTICYTFVSFLFFFSVIISWPWVHAAYVWQKSTIQTLESSEIFLSDNINSSIPRIIHQTYRNNFSIPLKWQQASNSCRTLHPNYQYKFWSDEEGRRLIKKEFPCLLSVFDSYPYDIQRADVIRLVVLYIYGGIYLDFDIICLKSLENLLKYGFILPHTIPVGLSNDFMMSLPKHPFLLKVLNDLPKANRNYFSKYPTVMFSTGPMFITHEASYYSDRSSLDILSPELYGKYSKNSSNAIFRHLKASSWHGKDASIVKWIYAKRYVFLFILIISIIMTFMIIYSIQKYTDLIKNKNDTSSAYDYCETKMTLQIPKYRKYIQITLFNFLLFLIFFNRFE